MIAFPRPGAAYSFLKVDTTPAVRHLPSKVKKIEYCDEETIVIFSLEKSHRTARA
jgi:hypothetical protein